MGSVLYVLVFFSGISALLFETLLFNQTGLVLGNSIWASSVVLAAFMGGLALGNGLAGRYASGIRRRLRVYALIEWVIGVCGLALVFWLPVSIPVINPVLRLFLNVPWALNGVRLAVTFLLMVLPAGAMGATLPLLVGALSGHKDPFGRILGRLYGFNTLGAVIGAVIGQAYLIERLGIRGTAVCAACGNVLVGIAAFATALRFERNDTPGNSRTVPCSPPRMLWLLAAAGLSGALLLALEVVWFRFLVLFVLPGSLAFALMLAVVLSGIALGGFAASWWLHRRGPVALHCSVVALVAGACTVAAYTLFDRAGGTLLDGIVVEWHHMVRLGVPLMFPVSLLSGMLFTLLGEAVNREADAEVRTTGMLTLSNTLGAMLGSLLGGFVLLPIAGIERSIFALAALYGVVAMFIELSKPRCRMRPGAPVWCAAGLFLVSVIFFPAGIMKSRYLQHGIGRLTAQEPPQVSLKPVAIREGLTETIVYLQNEIYGEPRFHRLVTNSFSMSSTALQSRRYMQLFVYLPVAIHPHPRKALLISFGVGSTAKALTGTRSLETIDVVDISRDILDLARIPFPDPKDNPLSDPRVRVHVEDGRFFLQTRVQRFDIITCEPPPPKAAGIVNLFTREYFQLVRNRLADGGIATYWLPAHSLKQNEALAVIRAFCDVFPDCTLWSGAGLDFILLGTRGAEGPVSVEHFSGQWRDPVVGPELKSLGIECPEQLGAMFIAGPGDLQALTRGVAPVIDDHPKRIGDHPVDHTTVTPVYWPWLDVTAARERFFASPEIRRLWPPSMRTAAIPYFEYQADLNGLMAGVPGTPAQELRRMDRVLAHSSLQTLVLWQLGSNAEAQRAARAASAKGRRDFMLRYEEAAYALSERKFGDAAKIFNRMSAMKPRDRWIQVYHIYATCLDGRTDEARSIATFVGLPGDPDPQARTIWNFLVERFNLEG